MQPEMMCVVNFNQNREMHLRIVNPIFLRTVCSSFSYLKFLAVCSLILMLLGGIFSFRYPKVSVVNQLSLNKKRKHLFFMRESLLIKKV